MTQDAEREVRMDNATLKYLWALREINKSLVSGLETADFVMDKWDELTPERRKSMIEKLQVLMKESNEAFGTEPPEH